MIIADVLLGPCYCKEYSFSANDMYSRFKISIIRFPLLIE